MLLTVGGVVSAAGMLTEMETSAAPAANAVTAELPLSLTGPFPKVME